MKLNKRLLSAMKILPAIAMIISSNVSVVVAADKEEDVEPPRLFTLSKEIDDEFEVDTITKSIHLPNFGDNNTLEALDIEVIEPVYGTPGQLDGLHPDVVQFIKEIGQSASESAQEHGLYASITIAQAIEESGYGKSGLSLAPHYNFFGIKGTYNGRSVTVQTNEDDGSGNLYSINAAFKSYPSIYASLEDHDNLLRNGLNGYYSGTWVENTNSYHDAAYWLQGRYASNTRYASNLITYIEKYNLTRFDKPLTDQDIEWLNSESLDPFEVPGKVIKKIKKTNAISISGLYK